MKSEEIRIDPEKDLIWTTVAEYEFFMAAGRVGMDAFAVRQHLIYTARRQNNNRVRATTPYIVNGTHMGERKVKAGKVFLLKHGFISYHQAEPTKGAPYMGKMYIEVRFPTLPTAGANTHHQTGSVNVHPTGAKPHHQTGSAKLHHQTAGAVSAIAQNAPRNSLGEKKEESPNKPPKYNDEHLRLAGIIAEHVEALDPKSFHRVGREKTVGKWADDIRKLETLDGRSIAEIGAVLTWAINDDFWAGNILSGPKFRKQFSTLSIQKNGDTGGNGKPAIIQDRYCVKCKRVEASSSTICTSCNGTLEVRNAN